MTDVVVVTGAASGIGEELARSLAREWTVVAADLPERLAELELAADEHGFVAVGADVSRPQDVEALFEHAGRSGRIGGVVSCAGVTRPGHVSETTPEMFDFLIGANLKSNFLVMRAALLALRRQGGAGSVVVVSSINATIGLPSQAVYTAAKAAVNSLVTAAAVEGGPYGTRVNAIAPAARTRMTESTPPATSRRRTGPSRSAGSANRSTWSALYASFFPMSPPTSPVPSFRSTEGSCT